MPLLARRLLPARPPATRARSWGAWLSVSVLLLVACQQAQSAAPNDPLTGPVNPDTAYQFLSSPDFLNADIADVSSSPLYREGQPNSITPSLRKSLDTVLDHMAGEGIRDFFVAGDLVEGHWGKDTARTGTFGPVDTEQHREQAVVRAGNLYYQNWLRLFGSRGLTTYPAVGDHDIGDNEWGLDTTDWVRFKQRHVPLWKRTFAQNVLTDEAGQPRFPNSPAGGPARDTAYAVRVNPEVLLVSVDVFERTQTDVETQLDADQFAWLEGVLADAVDDGVDWIIVQGHTPVVTPVRMIGSSGLMYRGGTQSPFWQLMKEYGVDLYLCGEVHATSMHQVDGITQICHGGLFAYGFSSYMRGDIDGGIMNLTVSQFRSTVDDSQRIWQTATRKGMPSRVVYDPEPYVRGTLTLTSTNRVVDSTGLLRPYGDR